MYIWQYMLQNYNYKLHFQNLSIYRISQVSIRTLAAENLDVCTDRLDTFGTHIVHCPFGGQWIVTHDVIQDIMYVFPWKNEHDVWRKWWYAFTSRVSLRIDLYMIQKDQVFVVNVVITDIMRKMVALSVINQPIVAIAKLSTITKVSKYKRL